MDDMKGRKPPQSKTPAPPGIDGEKAGGKTRRGTRAGTKRRIESSQRPRQVIKYDRAQLIGLREAKLSSTWPRALDKNFVGDSGLWDPVKLFDSDRKERVEVNRQRNAEMKAGGPPRHGRNQSYHYDDAPYPYEHEPPRTSRRRKRTREENVANASGIVLGPQKRTWASGCNPARSNSESEKENKTAPRPPSTPASKQRKPAGQGPTRKSSDFGRGPNHRRSHGRPYEEDTPAWFDEAPLDTGDKLELCGFPEEEDKRQASDDTKKPPTTPKEAFAEESKPQLEINLNDLFSSSEGVQPTGPSRLSKWMTAPEQSECKDLEKLICKDLKIGGSQAAKPAGAELLNMLNKPQQQQPQPQMDAKSVEASLKNLLFGGQGKQPAGQNPPMLREQGNQRQMRKGMANGQVKTLDEIEGRTPPGSPTQNLGPRPEAAGDNSAIYKLIGDLQVQMHDLPGRQQPQAQPQSPQNLSPGARGVAAPPASVPGLALPQLQAYILQNLQMQARLRQQQAQQQRKINPQKLLPQTMRWYRAMNNALQGTRLLKQQMGGQQPPLDQMQLASGLAKLCLSGDASAGGSSAPFPRAITKSELAGFLAENGSGQNQGRPIPALPIVPPMFSGAPVRGASAAGVPYTQLQAMLWKGQQPGGWNP